MSIDNWIGIRAFYAFIIRAQENALPSPGGHLCTGLLAQLLFVVDRNVSDLLALCIS